MGVSVVCTTRKGSILKIPYKDGYVIICIYCVEMAPNHLYNTNDVTISIVQHKCHARHAVIYTTAMADIPKSQEIPILPESVEIEFIVTSITHERKINRKCTESHHCVTVLSRRQNTTSEITVLNTRCCSCEEKDYC